MWCFFVKGMEWNLLMYLVKVKDLYSGGFVLDRNFGNGLMIVWFEGSRKLGKLYFLMCVLVCVLCIIFLYFVLEIICVNIEVILLKFVGKV